MERAWVSDSMTQGAAMRKSGLLPPRRREPNWISRVVVIELKTISQANSQKGSPPVQSPQRKDHAAAWGVARTAGAGGWASAATAPDVGRVFWSLCSSEAPMKAAKSGWGSRGLDLN